MGQGKKNNSIIPYQAQRAILVIAREVAKTHSSLVLIGRKANVWGNIQLIFTDLYMEMKCKIKRRD